VNRRRERKQKNQTEQSDKECMAESNKGEEKKKTGQSTLVLWRLEVNNRQAVAMSIPNSIQSHNKHTRGRSEKCAIGTQGAQCVILYNMKTIRGSFSGCWISRALLKLPCIRYPRWRQPSTGLEKGVASRQALYMGGVVCCIPTPGRLH
jgi:hypothetical protein